jgi:hypothetical protein
LVLPLLPGKDWFITDRVISAEAYLYKKQVKEANVIKLSVIVVPVFGVPTESVTATRLFRPLRGDLQGDLLPRVETLG